MAIDFSEEADHLEGWVTVRAWPLKDFSSLHEMSVPELLGSKKDFPPIHLFVEFSCNLHTPVSHHPKAHIVVDVKDASLPPVSSDRCFCITDIKRWRLKSDAYTSFDDYLSTLNNGQKYNFEQSKKSFEDSGCEILITKDWSQYIDRVNDLYLNVALRHNKHRIYDLNFFHKIAKKNEYELLSYWCDGKMIGAFILLEEGPTFHGLCCGLDYDYSSKSCIYSWANYEVIRLAIERKYENVDVGITASDSKKAIGFKPVLTRMDVYSKNMLLRWLLGFFSVFFSATLTSKGNIKLKLRSRKKKT